MIKAVGANGTFSDVDEAAAIVYAVDHGAKIINLSIGGEGTSPLETRAIQYAASHNVLLVAAAGNEYEAGNPVEYPAAALQPVGSKGQGGFGLAGCREHDVRQARVLLEHGHADLARRAGRQRLRRRRRRLLARVLAALPAPRLQPGLYGWSSGTSFSTPEVAGAAALVWAANPGLTAQQVAGILKATASGRGKWSPQLGYGVIDVAAAVAAARGQAVEPRVRAGSWLSLRRVSDRTALGARREAPPTPRAPRGPPPLEQADGDARLPPVTLQVRRGGSWHRLARTTTRLGGGIRWTVGLKPGRHVLRAIYRGRWDLRAAIRRKSV